MGRKGRTVEDWTWMRHVIWRNPQTLSFPFSCVQENSRKCNAIFYICLLLHHQGAKGAEGVKGADGVKGDMGRRGLKGPKGLKGPEGRKVQYSLVQKATLYMQHIKTHLHFRKKEQVINFVNNWFDYKTHRELSLLQAKTNSRRPGNVQAATHRECKRNAGKNATKELPDNKRHFS